MNGVKRFSELAALFHERLFVTLVIYADETGTHDPTGRQQGADVAGVVGWMATKEMWEAFCPRWQAVLDCYHVEVFHMSEFADVEHGSRRPDWPYLGWSPEKREAFINELIPIARDNTLAGVGGFVNVRAFNQYFPAWMLEPFEHPWLAAFRQFLYNVYLLVDDPLASWLDPGDKVAFFLDQSEFEGSAKTIFDAFRERRGPDHKMGTLTFADKKDYLPLQAADLLALRQRKVISRLASGKRGVNPGSWDEALASKEHLLITYNDDAGTQLIVRMMTDLLNRVGQTWADALDQAAAYQIPLEWNESDPSEPE